MLALVWATKYFRCYMYGRQLQVRTDHAALSYLRNFVDHNSRLMRWCLKLSELDFVVEHRPGSRIKHADALSHVCANKREELLSREKILKEQRRDEFCAKQEPGTCSLKSEFFIDEEGLMYRLQIDDRHPLMVPKALIHEIIAENHIPVYTGCPRRKGPNFGRVFLRSNYTDITQNTYIQSSMVTEILAREV